MAARQGAIGNSPSASAVRAGMMAASPRTFKNTPEKIDITKKMISLQACHKAPTLNLNKIKENIIEKGKKKTTTIVCVLTVL